MAFDVTKLPRGQLLAEAFPGQQLHESGWAKVHCTLPGCQHKRDDQDASLRLNVDSGAFECKTNGHTGKGWKALVVTYWGEERWKELCRAMGGTRKKPTLCERWRALDPERDWTEAYGIDQDLSGLFLAAGARYKGDPYSRNVIATRDESGNVVGIKWRLPDGERWQVGKVAETDPTAKYALTKGSKSKGVLWLPRPVAEGATLLVVAGEKDALVAASHLNPLEWAPVTGTTGESDPPWGLAELARGRDVVIAYDGDDAGRGGAWRVARTVGGTAKSVSAAYFPTDTPPGKDPAKPGWDLSEIVRHRGVGELKRLLSDLGPVSEDWRPSNTPADWRPWGSGDTPPARKDPQPQGESPREEGDASPGEIKTEYLLDTYKELNGEVVKLKQRGSGKNTRVIPICQFRGVPKAVRVEKRSVENPEKPGTWLETQQTTYRFELRDGPTIERTCAPGPREFVDLLDQTHRLAAATQVVDIPSRRRLHSFAIESTLNTVQESEGFEAVGPHPGIGWVAPGSRVRVRQGRIEDLEPQEEIFPPSHEPEFHRYRLARLSEDELVEASRFLVEDLITSDSAGGRYAIPLLGAFVAPPLWEYVRELDVYQRYVFFGVGESGHGKTTFTRAFLSLWGDFLDGAGLTTWRTTSFAIESLIHYAKGVPMLISDWKLSQFSPAMLRESISTFQGYGDRTAKGRGTGGGSGIASRKPPRAALVVDGEDLPTGEQSTLGRMVVLNFDQHKPGEMVGNVLDLSKGLMGMLPGVTARWIAWVQRNTRRLAVQLESTRVELLKLVKGDGAQRPRLVCHYAVQVLAIEAFADFLVDECGIGQRERLALTEKAWTYHVDMAQRQLGSTEGESAGDQFLTTLAALIAGGGVELRKEKDSTLRLDNVRAGGMAKVIGTYDTPHDKKWVAWIWPSNAIPEVQRHLTQGGGRRIEFSAAAIRGQLISKGVLRKQSYRRTDREVAGKSRLETWPIPLECLVDLDDRDMLYPPEDNEPESGAA